MVANPSSEFSSVAGSARVWVGNNIQISMEIDKQWEG